MLIFICCAAVAGKAQDAHAIAFLPDKNDYDFVQDAIKKYLGEFKQRSKRRVTRFEASYLQWEAPQNCAKNKTKGKKNKLNRKNSNVNKNRKNSIATANVKNIKNMKYVVYTPIYSNCLVRLELIMII